MEKDVQRFAPMVTEYRSTAREILKRAYHDKAKAINAKYDPQIDLNDREARDRRRDAIAMFEAFLLKYPNDKRWTPDAMFRLAELYYEKSAEEYLDADEAYKKALDTPEPARHAAPAGRLHADHQPLSAPADRVPELPLPRRGLLPARLLPGRDGRGPAGQAGAARARLLEPLQAARHARADAEAVAARAGRRGRAARRGVLQGVHAGPEGVEVHPRGVDAHRRVPLRQPERAEVRDRRLPQGADVQGLALLRPRAVQARLVVLPRQPLPRGGARVRQPGQVRGRAHGGRAEGRLRPAAGGGPVPGRQLRRARLGRRHAARSDHAACSARWSSTRAARRNRTCARCSSASATSTSTRRSTQDAIAVYKALLAKWPYYSDAPRVQDRIVHAYEKDRNLVAAAKEREKLGRSYTKGSDWYQHNKDNPEALAVARQLAEDALLTAATNVHAAAQACKTKWLENQKDTKKLEECKKLYATSAELYEKFLAAYPNSKRSYEFSAFYADALYYSGQLQAGDRRLPERPRFAAGQPVPGRRRVPDDQDVRRDDRRHEEVEGDRRSADPRREEHEAVRSSR